MDNTDKCKHLFPLWSKRSYDQHGNKNQATPTLGFILHPSTVFGALNRHRLRLCHCFTPVIQTNKFFSDQYTQWTTPYCRTLTNRQSKTEVSDIQTNMRSMIHHVLFKVCLKKRSGRSSPRLETHTITCRCKL